MKKNRIIILCVIFLAVLVIFCSMKDDFHKMKEKREAIAERVVSGDIAVDEHGWAVLPEEEAYLSDTGKCCVVECDYGQYSGQYAVYFFSYTGMLGDSKGYLHIIESLDDGLKEKASHRFHFVEVKPVDTSWYSCKTSD